MRERLSGPSQKRQVGKRKALVMTFPPSSNRPPHIAVRRDELDLRRPAVNERVPMSNDSGGLAYSRIKIKIVLLRMGAETIAVIGSNCVVAPIA